MSVHVAAGNHHTYRANEHDTVLSEVAEVFCVLMPRALLVAGFSEAGEVVMARYNSYSTSDPAWEPGFFEHEFIDETLFGVPQQVKALFIGSHEELIIPEKLYKEQAARRWMESLQAICPDDVLHTHGIEAAGAQHTFAVPARIDKLLHRYFGDTRILPVSAYQFFKPNAGTPYLLQTFIAEDTVIATLHRSGKLLWHQQFPYGNVEDIAWQAAHLCRELAIPKIDLHVECTMLCESSYELGVELERFFPKIKWSASGGNDKGPWAPVLYLLQQLYACAL
jgi:hypothetical protein